MVKYSKRIQPHSSLSAWRKARGFTQRQAAEHLGISQAYYSKLELQHQTPRPKLLRRLNDLTGVPLDELMGIAS